MNVIKRKKEKNPRKDFTHSQSTKDKIAEKAKGREWTQERKDAIKGRTPWNKGKTQKKDGKPVLHFTLSNNLLKEYDSIKTAEIETGISRWKIYASIKNIVKEPYEWGYFKFKNT
jgi:hypothetical protein